MPILQRLLLDDPGRNRRLRDHGTACLWFGIAFLIHCARLPLVHDEITQFVVGVAAGFALGFTARGRRSGRRAWPLARKDDVSPTQLSVPEGVIHA